MRIRPHHLLCMGNYIGKGYSREFEINMSRVIAELKNRSVLTPVEGADDICTACPFDHRGVCETEEKVRRYDREAADRLGLVYGAEYEYEELARRVADEIYMTGDLTSICGDCEWHSLCLDVIKNNRKNQ